MLRPLDFALDAFVHLLARVTGEPAHGSPEYPYDPEPGECRWCK